MRKLFITILFLLLAVNVFAADYYISSSTGNDSTGDGSEGNPYKTFDHSGLDNAGALSAGDNVYFKRGDTWTGNDTEIHINSGGSAGNPITLQAYGEGDNPVFIAASTTTWTRYGATDIYYKSWTTEPKVIFEADRDDYLYFKSGGVGAIVQGSHAYDFTNKIVYVWRHDGEDPGAAGNTTYIPDYNYQGVLTIANGRDYITVKHLTIKYARNDAFATRGDYTIFDTCRAEWAGGAGFYFFHNVAYPYGADNGLAQACYATRTNIYTSQAFTVEGADTWLIDCTAEYNYMAGFDFLDYNDNTNATRGVALRCFGYRNALRSTPPWTSWDPNFYVDGGNNISFIDCVSSDAGYTNANTNAGFSINDEFSGEVFNIYLEGCLSYGSKEELWIGNASYSPDLDYIYVYNSTFAPSGESNAAIVVRDMANAEGGLFFYNNIVYAPYNYCILGKENDNLQTKYTGDYNMFYRTDGIPHSQLFKVNNQATDKSLATWRTYTGDDANSVEADPIFADNGSLHGEYHLSNTASGQGDDSPALDAGDNDLRETYRRGFPTGTTRTDKVADDAGDWDMGYHYKSQIVYPTGGVELRGVEM